MFISSIIGKIFGFIFPVEFFGHIFRQIGHLFHLLLIASMLLVIVRTTKNIRDIAPESKLSKQLAIASNMFVFILALSFIVLLKMHMVLKFLEWL